jgi:transcriptional regulator with XRE-family HTH domain
VPTRKPLPSVEIEICRRIRLIRVAARLSRPVFARFLGLDSSKLSNIELFRVPVDSITATSICRIFRVSPGWLMTGEGRPTQVLPAWVYAPLPDTTARTLFSQAYPHLEKRVSRAEQKLSEQTKAIAQEVEQRQSEENFDLSPAAFERSWQEATLKVGAADRAEIDAQLATAVFGSPFTVEFENELAIVSEFDDKYSMREVLAPSDFVEQLQQLTQQRGAKSKLARLLKVSRQRLNEWLSGRSKPSARYLLLLLNWIRAQRMRPAEKREKIKREASEKSIEFSTPVKPKQKKRAGSALTQPALKTRKSKSTKYEKAKSDRKKK